MAQSEPTPSLRDNDINRCESASGAIVYFTTIGYRSEKLCYQDYNCKMSRSFSSELTDVTMDSNVLLKHNNHVNSSIFKTSAQYDGKKRETGEESPLPIKYPSSLQVRSYLSIAMLSAATLSRGR